MQRSRRRVRRWVLAPFGCWGTLPLLVVVVGLLAMHGLGQHGSAGTDPVAVGLHATSTAMTSPTPRAGSTAGDDATARSGHPAQEAADGGKSRTTVTGPAVPHRGPGSDILHLPANGSGHPGSGTLQMCLTVLATILLLLTSGTHFGGGITVPHWCRARTVTLARRGRDPDPPSLSMLCIRRC